MSHFPGEMEHLRRVRSPDSLVLTPMPPQYDGTAEQRKAKKQKKSNKKKSKKNKKDVTASQSDHADDKVDQANALSSTDGAGKADISGEPSGTAEAATPLIVHGETPTDRAIMDLGHVLDSGLQLGHGSIADASKEQDTSSESTTIREVSVHGDENRVREQPASVANDGPDPFVCHTHRRLACKFDPRCCVHRDPKDCSCPPRWSCCCLHHLGDCCHCVLVPGPANSNDDKDNQEEPQRYQDRYPRTRENGFDNSDNLNQKTQTGDSGTEDVSGKGQKEVSERPEGDFEEFSQQTEGDTEKVSSDDDQSVKEDKCDDKNEEIGGKTVQGKAMNGFSFEEDSKDKTSKMPEIRTADAAEHQSNHKNEDKTGEGEVKTADKTSDKTEGKWRCSWIESFVLIDECIAASDMPAALPSRPVRSTDLMGPLARHLLLKLFRHEFCDSSIMLRSATGNFLPMDFPVHKVVVTQSALAAACLHSSDRIFAIVREKFDMIKGFEYAIWHLYGHPIVARDKLRDSTLAAMGYTQDARNQLDFHVQAAMADFAICYATSGVFFQLHAVAEAGFTMIAELVDWDMAELVLCFGIDITRFAVNLDGSAGPGHEQAHNQNIARELQEIWGPFLIGAVMEFICKYLKENEGFALFAGAQSTVMPDRIPESLRPAPSAVMVNPKLSEVKFGSFSTVNEQKPAKETVILSAILINLPFKQLSLTFTIMTARNVLSVELAQAVISAREARRQQALRLLSQQSGPGRSAGAEELGYREYLAGTAPGPETSPAEIELRREWVGIVGAVSKRTETAARPTHSLTARE